MDNYDSISWKLFESKREYHWQKVVGGAQKMLPAHILSNEYCRLDQSFEPCPSFTESTLPRMRCVGDSGLYNGTENCLTAKYNGGMLGDTFGLYRGEASAAYISELPGGGLYQNPKTGGYDIPAGIHENVHDDLRAIQKLSKVRVQQLEALKFELLSTASQDQESETELKELKCDMLFLTTETNAAPAAGITDHSANLHNCAKTSSERGAITRSIDYRLRGRR